MNDGGIFFAAFLSMILYFVILFYVIASAAGTRKRDKEMLRQSLMLAALAKKMGVTQEELSAIHKQVDG